MPLFTQPITEANPCHDPKSGEFCSGTAGTKSAPRPKKLVSRRLSNGEYLVNDRYLVRKRAAAGFYETGISWYWTDKTGGAKSGYFDTKAQTMTDLEKVATSSS